MIDPQITATQQRRSEQSLKQYNMNILKQYLKLSKCSIVFLLVLWIIFIIECIKTWTQSSVSNAPASISYEVLIRMGANVPILVKQGQIYRLVAATFLHSGILHILMNSMTLLLFCAQIQAQVHLKIYLTVYFIGGIYGNMLSDFYNLNFGNKHVIAVGASTSICAIMGLYIGNLYIQSKKRGTVEVAKKQIASMLIYLLFISLLPGIDFFGHFGSLIAGLVIGVSFMTDNDGQFARIKWVSRLFLTIYTFLLLMIFV